MAYFFYGRDRPGTGHIRRETMERHWSFMDGYADQLIARGPTLTAPRTMWGFTEQGGQRFLVIGHGRQGSDGAGCGQLEYLRRNAGQSLISYGPTFSDHGEWTGSVTLLELPDRAAAEQLMGESPATRSGLYEEVEMHYWRFGGRSQPGL